jgi:hypothetical protein
MQATKLEEFLLKQCKSYAEQIGWDGKENYETFVYRNRDFYESAPLLTSGDGELLVSALDAYELYKDPNSPRAFPFVSALLDFAQEYPEDRAIIQIDQDTLYIRDVREHLRKRAH